MRSKEIATLAAGAPRRLERPTHAGVYGVGIGVLISALLLSCDANQYPTRDAATSSDARRDGGSVQITGTANRCPMVSIGATPPDAKVGEHIDVIGGASDPDPSAKFTFAWSAVAGTFVNPAAPSTQYNCLVPGPQTLSLKVSDGQCTSTATISVYCFALPGSGGAPGTGGRGGAGGTGGRATTGSGGGGAGGGGRSGSGGATAGGTGGAGVMMCSADPTKDEGEACQTCTADNCLETDSCEGYASDAERQLCLKVYCCLQANHCAVRVPNDVYLYGCYCGSRPSDKCFTPDPGDPPPDGPCARIFEEATRAADPVTGKTDYPTVKMRLVNRDYPAGGAILLYSCRQAFCSKFAETPSDACHL